MPRRSTAAAVIALTLGASLGARAEEGGAWNTVLEGPVTVKTRQRPGLPVHEIHAEADLDASAYDVQRAILSADRYASFMPFVKESRYVGEPEADGSRWVYTRIVPPVVTPRDYVVRARTLSTVAADGQGVFANTWEADGKRLPSRARAIRLQLNAGSWRVTALPSGRSHIVYRFVVDPGGLIPAFLADLGNRSAVPDTLRAVEREARRLRAADEATARAGR